MSFRILYITATSSEAFALKKVRGIISVPGGYRIGNCEISLLITGIGSISTAWTMFHWLSAKGKPDLAINAGIAGSYKDNFKIGDVVMPITDCFADSGIEDSGKFLTLAEAGLTDANKHPFREGLIFSDSQYIEIMKHLIRPVNAITVNTASGSAETIKKLSVKFNPDIETMEGATFFYICSREKIPFLALRAISNSVEPRNRNNWNIKLALDNLTEKLNEIILTLQ